MKINKTSFQAKKGLTVFVASEILLVTKKCLWFRNILMFFFYFKAQRHYERDRLNVYRRNGPKKNSRSFCIYPDDRTCQNSACEVKVIKTLFEITSYPANKRNACRETLITAWHTLIRLICSSTGWQTDGGHLKNLHKPICSCSGCIIYCRRFTYKLMLYCDIHDNWSTLNAMELSSVKIYVFCVCSVSLYVVWRCLKKDFGLKL